MLIYIRNTDAKFYFYFIPRFACSAPRLIDLPLFHAIFPLFFHPATFCIVYPFYHSFTALHHVCYICYIFHTLLLFAMFAIRPHSLHYTTPATIAIFNSQFPACSHHHHSLFIASLPFHFYISLLRVYTPHISIFVSLHANAPALLF